MYVRRLLAALALTWSASVALAQPGPEIPPNRGKGNPIPGRFVVTLEERADPRGIARQYGVEPDFVYERVLVGFAGQMSEPARSGRGLQRPIGATGSTAIRRPAEVSFDPDGSGAQAAARFAVGPVGTA